MQIGIYHKFQATVTFANLIKFIKIELYRFGTII